MHAESSPSTSGSLSRRGVLAGAAALGSSVAALSVSAPEPAAAAPHSEAVPHAADRITEHAGHHANATVFKNVRPYGAKTPSTSPSWTASS